jgi:hypothetical protein
MVQLNVLYDFTKSQKKGLHYYANKVPLDIFHHL